MKKLTTIKGTYDLLPGETEYWRDMESVIHDFMALHGYGEIRTPAFERTELFIRGVGEGTDIVTKEMYTWTDSDKKGTSLTLKPELTAPVVRAYIQHNMAAKSPIQRLYYIDSLFRRERPQKGRQRQFHQFGVEAIGSPHPEQDAEVISIAYRLFDSLGLESLNVKINTIGSPDVRNDYLALLKNTLQPHMDEFCSICQERLDKNPLRLFDCKNNHCQDLLDQHAPFISDHISPEDADHFNTVTDLLGSMAIPYIHDRKMVRGLDYYTRTTFEITSRALGAQDALCGGGRYDKLVEVLGGSPTPAVGFAAGMERLFIALRSGETTEPDGINIYIVVLGDKPLPVAMNVADDLRRKGISVIMETLRRSMKAQMREANRNHAQYVIIFGEDELQEGNAVIKNMESGEQHTLPIDEIARQFSPDTEHHH